MLQHYLDFSILQTNYPRLFDQPDQQDEFSKIAQRTKENLVLQSFAVVSYMGFCYPLMFQSVEMKQYFCAVMGYFCGRWFDSKKLNMDSFKQFETDYQGSLGNHENPLETVNAGQKLPSLENKIMIVHDVAKIYYCAENRNAVPQIAVGKCVSGVTYSETKLLASDVYPDGQMLPRT